MGLQAGFTKSYRFLCLWKSRAPAQHYKTKEWPTRNSNVPGMKNENAVVIYQARINEKLFKSLTKHPSNRFDSFCKKFLKLSQTKLESLLVHKFGKFMKTPNLKKL